MKAKNIIRDIVNRATDATVRIEKKVVFDCFRGRQYADNPRAVSEKMHELFPDYEIVWGIAGLDKFNRDHVPEYVKLVEFHSQAFRRERMSAAAYVCNESMQEGLHKKKGQLFIQTWHGDRGIKRILYDAWEHGERPAKVMDEELADLFVVGSDYAQNRIKSAFHYYGEVLATGCPRNDRLVSPENETGVRQALAKLAGGLDAADLTDCRLLLYAPTLRANHPVLEGALDIERTLDHLEAKGGRWVCLVRAHPKSLGIQVSGSARMVDVSAYPDIADLLMVSDALVTDYSSCAGDFILRRKPVLLAQFDQETYARENRKLFVDPAEAGFLIARDQDELERYIDTMSDDDFAENCEKIMSFFGTHESGSSAADVCRYIDEHYRKNS